MGVIIVFILAICRDQTKFLKVVNCDINGHKGNMKEIGSYAATIT